MRTELKRVHAIEEDADGNLTVLRREVHPKIEHEYLVMALKHSAYALLSNIAHNTNPDKNETNWAQLTAYTGEIRKSDMPKIKRISQDRLSELANSFDDLFMGYEKLAKESKKETEVGVVAVGLYFFEERDERMAGVWES